MGRQHDGNDLSGGLDPGSRDTHDFPRTGRLADRFNERDHGAGLFRRDGVRPAGADLPRHLAIELIGVRRRQAGTGTSTISPPGPA